MQVRGCRVTWPILQPATTIAVRCPSDSIAMSRYVASWKILLLLECALVKIDADFETVSGGGGGGAIIFRRPVPTITQDTVTPGYLS